jgi:hypothetical protein
MIILEQPKSKIRSHQISIDKPNKGRKIVKILSSSCERPISSVYNHLSVRLNSHLHGEIPSQNCVYLNSKEIDKSLEIDSKLSNRRAYEKHEPLKVNKRTNSIKGLGNLNDV